MFIGYVSAENIIVEGEINADIQTENLYLKSTGIVDGDVMYRDIVIDSGGMLKSQMVQNISKMNNLIKLKNN
jgi:cytoskeletal protein CcmA (bactofilin family)